MNEIDLYLKLIDNTEANLIIKAFNENTKSNDIDFKRMKIRGIFKGQTLKAKPNRKGVQQDPFQFVILRHEIPFLQTLSEKEFFILMNDNRTRLISDYAKFANILIRFPVDASNFTNKINENLLSGKSLFDFGYKIETEEEMQEFFTRTSSYSNQSMLHKEIKDLKKYVDQKDYVYFNDAKIQHMTFYEFYNDLQKYDKNEYLYELGFLLAKPKLDIKIMQTLLIDVSLSLISEKQKQLNEENKEIEKLKKRIDEVKEKTINEYNKKVIELSEENKRLGIEIQSYKGQKEKDENDIENLRIYINKVKYDNEIKINNIISEYENRIEKILHEKDADLGKLREIEEYCKYTFPKNNNDNYIIAVIHSFTNIYVSQMMYPECYFISSNNWIKSINNIFFNSVKILIVQRESMSSTNLIKIEQAARKKGIKIKIECISNEKTLIEKIANIKNFELMEVNYDNTFFA